MKREEISTELYSYFSNNEDTILNLSLNSEQIKQQNKMMKNHTPLVPESLDLFQIVRNTLCYSSAGLHGNISIERHPFLLPMMEMTFT